MIVSDINNPVSNLPGIGPQMSKTLSKLNIFTVGDLLQYYPYDYEDRTQHIFLKDFNKVKKVHTVARVINHEWFGYGRMKTLKVIINDGTATANLICFNRPFLENTLPIGSIITVTGQFSIKYNALQSNSFEVERMYFKTPEEENSADIKTLTPLNSGILPIYHLTEGLSQKNLCKAIANALKQYTHGIDNEIPNQIIEKRKLLQKQQALFFIHQPQTIEQAIKARKTLAFEELYLYQKIIVSNANKRKGHLNKTPEIKEVSKEDFISSLSPLQKQLLDTLKFEPTPDQRKVIYEMDCDIDRSYIEKEAIMKQLDEGHEPPTKPCFSMARLLQGDVGAGKTLVSLFVCLRIVSWKGQCAFMAPTEILARQHAETTSSMLSSLGVRVAFLTGNIKAKGRTQILKALKEGEIDIIVGTHALFSSNVRYNDLELAVIDEQHRFGVLQRQAIIEKGRYSKRTFTFEPNILMMSATPIPQSLALTVFGDLDVSTIHTMPNGRKPIITRLVREGNEHNAYKAVEEELKKGHQAYFVYPAINSDENIKSAERAFEYLSTKVYPNFKCALVHSKIDEQDQIEILEGFKKGTIQVLAATTVIEVGVDVPNATSMVIEQADHFGLAQLHQLRGRVGRGSDQSYCYLIFSQKITETGIERMKALRESTDGFYIAEQDLKTRGPGELTGTAQAGALEFHIADLSRDMTLLEESRADLIDLV